MKKAYLLKIVGKNEFFCIHASTSGRNIVTGNITYSRPVKRKKDAKKLKKFLDKYHGVHEWEVVNMGNPYLVPLTYKQTVRRLISTRE